MPQTRLAPAASCEVSVLMPVYNAGPFLVSSIASIVEQTFDNWELLCIDDGSTDESLRLLEKFARLDPRIRVFTQENKGIVSALQVGIEQSRGKLLARMDADDISVRERLQVQREYLQGNPDVVVVGGAALEIDADGDPLRVTRFPRESEMMVRMLLQRQCPLIHPSVMMRRDAVLKVGGYRQSYQWVEDYDLWLRLATQGKLANMNAIVLAYRQHASSVCWSRSDKQRELINSLMRDAYASRNLPCPEAVLARASQKRSHAGPGKWMRMALKGGHTGTAWKHFRKLWRSECGFLYKCRMTLEFLVRYLMVMRVRKPPSAEQLLPDLSAWNARIARL